MNRVENLNAVSSAAAGIGRVDGASEQAHAEGRYVVECYGSDGKLKWSDDFENLVTTGGKNFALDTVFAGSAYTAAWYVGLITNSSYSAVAAADTMASHSGWTESQNYSQSTRPVASFSAASAGSKSLSSAAVFSMNGADTIVGCFIASNSTKGGTTGTLYSAGAFTGGNKTLQNGDTLNVSWTGSM